MNSDVRLTSLTDLVTYLNIEEALGNKDEKEILKYIRRYLRAYTLNAVELNYQNGIIVLAGNRKHYRLQFPFTVGSWNSALRFVDSCYEEAYV